MGESRVWNEEEMAKGYIEMAALNLAIAREFFLLEEEAEKTINNNLEKEKKGE